MHQDMGLRSVVKDICVASFTEEGNLLSQWRAYGAVGAGYSIGFQDLRVPDSGIERATAGTMLVKCEYDQGTFRERVHSCFELIGERFTSYVERCLDDMTCRGEVLKTAYWVMFRCAGKLAPSLKHEAFREEKEWRIVVIPRSGRQSEAISYRPTNRGLVPYVPISLCESGKLMPIEAVYVGPTQDPEAGKRSTIAFLNGKGYGGCQIVEDSGIPFRSVH